MPHETDAMFRLPLGVSRETRARLEGFVTLLRQWQSRINLVAPEALPELWSRHVADSLQLHMLKPAARTWLDLGSGGGFPGLVLACVLADLPDGEIHLVESNRKKAAFLQYVVSHLALPARIHARRVEDVVTRLPIPEIVTARALAPLDVLLDYTIPLLKSGAVGLFPKGREHARELTEAMDRWHLSYRLHESATDPAARLVEIISAERRDVAKPQFSAAQTAAAGETSDEAASFDGGKPEGRCR
ncbi:MAG: 16S rRNA (guanine(527)-N(7))-methyltransferase RsmG [Hyphomicrobiales bacterium]|uniref:16S rRNA (guanine(527)-N(7))-methyltransferase RsmG n=1 Tax=Rhabdaerophilum calidifontis TaxID=2604328 RepID=UPI00123A018B|nr:16S rRNA (guanine(527)-N(7))-methyltransferase RsmG [Rhabdaerophilum calidifontis]MCA1951934.1 16S rRNA (guanine(527)-N(7))-methyltransferase RsmG [Hyphomicrobiales bacterium]MCA1999059.1 16S rRNA (guanine(527)-N(7))-methyltransferase RsmG [Hyphomicrobiales bacterium]